MRSKTSHEGYLLIDDRAGGGRLFESATVTCAHCQVTFLRNPLRARPRGYCRNCDAYICDKPECSILRPQRLMSNSPCRGFVWITRMMFGDQIHLEAPVGHADSFDLKGISEAIMMRNGFHTLSGVSGVEIDCEYGGECSTLSRGETFNWALTILGPGIITVR